MQKRRFESMAKGLADVQLEHNYHTSTYHTILNTLSAYIMGIMVRTHGLRRPKIFDSVLDDTHAGARPLFT